MILQKDRSKAIATWTQEKQRKAVAFNLVFLGLDLAHDGTQIELDGVLAQALVEHSDAFTLFLSAPPEIGGLS